MQSVIFLGEPESTSLIFTLLCSEISMRLQNIPV
jgi:hypothetical protein